MQANYRIPIIRQADYAGDLGQIEIDYEHPLHHEELVLLSDYPVTAQSYYARTDGHNPPFFRAVPGSRPDVWVRKTIAEMLVQVNQLLLPYNREVFVLDGYRSVECQRGLWDFYYAQARQLMPAGNHEDWANYCKDYIVDPSNFSPDDPNTWSAHANGAAVDVTLRCLLSQNIIDMGGNFEEITEMSDSAYYEGLLNEGKVVADDPGLINRRQLHWAMHQTGFINDPFVFWHYDWGSQLYVKLANKLSGRRLDKAWYDYLPQPALPT